MPPETQARLLGGNARRLYGIEPITAVTERLKDYKVRIINGQQGTAARTRVFIVSSDSESTWGTVGVSDNIIEASWLALVDSFEYKLRQK